MQKAVYAGSFDPVTNGHVWIIEKAAAMFDHLTIAIGKNSSKKYTFTLNDRLNLLKESTAHLDNITICHFENELLVNYAKQNNIEYMVRGIRNSTDYEYEKGMRYINSDICNTVTTIFLMPPRQYNEISSSLIKELVGNNGWEETAKKYLPPSVFAKMVEWHGNKKTAK